MVRDNPRIHVLEHAFLSDLIVRDGHIAGVRLVERDVDGNAETHAIDATRCHPRHRWRRRPSPTPPIRPWPPADGLAAALLRAGAQVADFGVLSVPPHRHGHRRTLPSSPKPCAAKARYCSTNNGHRFMTDIDPKAELAPRDVVARANFPVPQAQGGRPVMLDKVRPWPRRPPDLAAFLRRLPDHRRLHRAPSASTGAREPIPVAPAATMDGRHPYRPVRTHQHPRSVCGPANARTGVQGANRLASNSLLGRTRLWQACRFGRSTRREWHRMAPGIAFADSEIIGLPVAHETPWNSICRARRVRPMPRGMGTRAHRSADVGAWA